MIGFTANHEKHSYNLKYINHSCRKYYLNLSTSSHQPYTTTQTNQVIIIDLVSIFFTEHLPLTLTVRPHVDTDNFYSTGHNIWFSPTFDTVEHATGH